MNQSNRRDISNYQRPIDNTLNDSYRTFTRVNGFLVPIESECDDDCGFRAVKGIITSLAIMGLVYGLTILFFCQ